MNREKRTNTGHAVLSGTRNPPKMRRRNGRTDGPMDGRTDRPSYRDARTHLKTGNSPVRVNHVTRESSSEVLAIEG